MNINILIFRNLKKNLKNYYLYVFALVFSVALYFSFVTLQYDPAMDATKGTVKGGASIRAASFLLIAIVTIFVLYANTIFIKRRSQEIGLFQLIGMNKAKIFRILSIENLIDSKRTGKATEKPSWSLSTLGLTPTPTASTATPTIVPRS